jgi:hypothetical protein
MGMSRKVAFGACLLALPLLGTTMLASASAAEPAFYECAKLKGGKYEDKQCTTEAGSVKGEKYELKEGIRKGKVFKGKGGAVRLYVPAINAPVPCTGSKDEGKLASPTTVEGLVVSFTGCSTMFRPCTSAGAKRGEVRTAPLDGQLGEIAPGAPGLLAVAHTLKGPGSIASMACEGLNIEVGGAIIGEVSGDVNVMSKSFTFTYAEAENGEPAVTKFEGGETEVLESVVNGSGPFVSSLRGTITNKSEELEIKG